MTIKKLVLPKDKLDTSGELELRLAEQLAEFEPDADLTQVDLTPFKPLKAKIDCITLRHPETLSKSLKAEMKAKFGKRIKFRPNPIGTRSGILQPLIGLQDPTLDDLCYLTTHFPDQTILRFEIAVDAYLPEGSNDLYLLRQLKEQMRHCLAPQIHSDIRKFYPTVPPLKRKYFGLERNLFLTDTTKSQAPLTTIIWETDIGQRVSLYIKTRDSGRDVPRYFLRIEVMMNQGACDDAGLRTLSDLPVFAKMLRKHAAPAFHVVSGFKRNDSDGSKWRAKGAIWDLDGSKGLGFAAECKDQPKIRRCIEGFRKVA